MCVCVYNLRKPFASELETHSNEFNVSQVSATLYTFLRRRPRFKKTGVLEPFAINGRVVRFCRNFPTSALLIFERRVF